MPGRFWIGPIKYPGDREHPIAHQGRLGKSWTSF